MGDGRFESAQRRRDSFRLSPQAEIGEARALQDHLTDDQ